MICSGGKVRERPEGENCESNFSESPSNCVVKQVLGNEVSVRKLVELLEATTVAARLFFYLTGICSGGKQVLGNGVSVKKLVELLEATTGATRRGKLRKQF